MNIDWFYYMTAILMQAGLFVVTYPLAKFFARFEVLGKENLRDLPRGPIIIMANHASQLDPGLLNLGIPWTHRLRPIFAVALSKIEYLHLPLGKLLYGGKIFWLGGAYPAYKKKSSLHDSLPHHLDVLQKNMTVGIFPEGKISKDGKFGVAHPGVALMAHKSNAVVIPAYLYGGYFMEASDFFRRRRKLRVIFGKPIRFLDYADPSREYDRIDYRKPAEDMFDEVKKLAKDWNEKV